jgi:MFS family permease
MALSQNDTANQGQHGNCDATEKPLPLQRKLEFPHVLKVPSESQSPSLPPYDHVVDGETGLLALFFLMLGVCLSSFLVALDRTIVATAAPRITDQFHAPADVGWYGSAYLLTSCAFQPLYGRVYSHFDVKWSFLVALGMFELGSLICGVAPSSNALIVGRAVSGLGCAGVFAGNLVIIAHSVPLAKRPVYTGVVGAMYVHIQAFP